jgi:hypothetical protein
VRVQVPPSAPEPFHKLLILQQVFLCLDPKNRPISSVTHLLTHLAGGIGRMKPTIGSPSYLVRNPYSYCFRMKVPKDLQGIVGKMCDFSYKNELPDVFPEVFPRISEGSLVVDEQESETLQRVFEAFWKEKRPGWKDRTVTEYTTCRNHLLSFLGPDTQIHTIDYQKGRDYKNLLMETRNK